MIYKFKSKAAGDVIMMGPTGDRVLGLMGREPAPRGILLVADMPAALAALSEAIARDEALRAAAAQPVPPDEAATEPAPTLEPISLRQRAWPLVEMIKRCHAEDEPIVWGV
ncbi:DUF1840 domain-containing protein [Ideonella livida]|uniref:DUF1840 domain-containing protein n=1 Tax=Ideonella livida TaxID=2707176 RepID=A0A7C9PIB1_9BURK|nr:DUF1840 domain-containing protein [Ideonella livida]NDY91931.1 DUF1840 domain-containing protein [Ideonella livida]